MMESRWRVATHDGCCTRAGGAARHAAYAAGQAACVAHVAARAAHVHEIKAAQRCPAQRRGRRGSPRVRVGNASTRHNAKLVLDDQRLRNDICWSVFRQLDPSSRLCRQVGPRQEHAAQPDHTTARSVATISAPRRTAYLSTSKLVDGSLITVTRLSGGVSAEGVGRGDQVDDLHERRVRPTELHCSP